MTVLDARPAGPTAYGAARLLAGVTSGRHADLTQHRSTHGDQRFHDRAALARLADQVRLLGRGERRSPSARSCKRCRTAPRHRCWSTARRASQPARRTAP